jgi:hypothetical protein
LSGGRGARPASGRREFVTDADSGWFGVRFLDAPDASVSDLEYVDFRDTFYAVSLDSLSGDIKDCDFDGWTGSPGDIFLERDTRLLTGKEWVFTSSAVFRISEFSAVQPSWGADSTRNEIYLDGILSTENGAALTFESAESSPAARDWYGIRIPDFSTKFLVDDATIRHARSGLVLENTDDTWPDLEDLVEEVTFESNYRDVTVAGDRVIEGGGATEVLTIPAGLKIGFTDRRDNTTTTGEADTLLAELIIREGGQVLAQGTDSSKVSFGSDNSVADTLSWYGIRLQLDAVLSSGYGYCESAYSKFEYVEVSDAQFGFRLEGQDTTVCAPTLDHVTFSNIALTATTGDEVPRHIYVDQADVRIPYGYWNGSAYVDSLAKWDLEAPAYVVFADGIDASQDLPDSILGHEGKEDLFVHGLLVTRPDAATGDSLVVFRPETAHNATGDDWGGIWVDYTAQGSRIDNADIGHAIDPLFFSWPDSCFVRSSRVHHYRDDAIWIDQAYDDGITIQDSQILRGGALADSLGVSAIRAIDSSPLVIQNNDIYDYGHSGQQPAWTQSDVDGGAVRIINGKTWCGSNPTSSEEVLIQTNRLVGPGRDYTLRERIAFDFDGLCGSTNRDVTVQNNAVIEWFWGVDMTQAVDVQMTCNLLKDNRNGLLYSRTESGLPTRLRRNHIAYSAEVSVETDIVEHLAMGPSDDRGENWIQVETDNKYLRQNDTDPDSNVLHAEYNQWQVGNNTPDTDPAVIRANFDGDGPASAVIVDNAHDDLTLTCLPDEPSTTAPGTGTIAVVQSGTMDEAPQAVVSGAPLRTRLEWVGPSPLRTETVFAFAVAGNLDIPVTLSIYDVAGRRVARLVDARRTAGRYEAVWNGRGSDGQRVAPGVYFARLEAGDVRETRKVVVLR